MNRCGETLTALILILFILMSVMTIMRSFDEEKAKEGTPRIVARGILEARDEGVTIGGKRIEKPRNVTWKPQEDIEFGKAYFLIEIDRTWDLVPRRNGPLPLERKSK